jgi:hypothetical protein
MRIRRVTAFTIVLLGLATWAVPGLLERTASRAAHASPLGNEPSQLRLSWSEDPRTTMTAMWQTAATTATSTAEYGLTEKLGQQAAGRRVTYPYETGVLHEATIRGLRPGTGYFYRVGDPEGGFSTTYRFRTAPAGVEGFTFTAFGDHGTTNLSRQNVERVVARPPAFHLILGDLSYANGKQTVWDDWFTLVEPLARGVPIMPTLGNHENEKIGDERIGYVAYLARLALPAPETWYSFDYAGVRFVAFNSDDSANPDQLRWLDHTLVAAHQDQAVRWLILYMHHPLYSSNVRRLNNVALIERLRQRLDDFGVDLVLAGHNHNYERSYPLRGDASRSQHHTRYRQSEGTIFVTSGGGGKSFYQFVPEQPAITAYRESVAHYLRVHVPAHGPLALEAVRTADGSVMDAFRIEPTETPRGKR